MEHCPTCGALLLSDMSKRCSNCGWSEKKAALKGGPMPSKPPLSPLVDRVLGSPPTCHKAEVNEARYLTHCVNIARIITHSGLSYHQKIKEYLRITKEEEVA